jgi:HK97 family phage major capsid protein
MRQDCQGSRAPRCPGGRLPSRRRSADTDFAEQLPQLLGDSKALLENTASSVGTGSGQPKGIVPAATTTVTSATVATFAVADIYALQQALTLRARYGKSLARIGNIAQINRLRAFDTAGGSSYWTNLGQGAHETVLGMRLAEASGMVSTLTTGSPRSSLPATLRNIV